MSCQVIGLLGLLALHSGCPRPLLGQKAAFWAKTVPLWVLGGPEEVQYQSKVCGNHESNTVRAASGSRVQVWSPGPSEDLQGHQKESIFSFSESNDFFYLISKREGGSHWINNFLTETSSQAPRCASWKAYKLRSSQTSKLTSWQIYNWQIDKLKNW